jgi:hypothetical protein
LQEVATAHAIAVGDRAFAGESEHSEKGLRA